MARPLDVGRRHVLFSRFIHGNRDLILGFAFELRDGKAYALWEQPGYDRPVGELPGAVVALTEEQTFVSAVRDAASHPGPARYFSAPRKWSAAKLTVAPEPAQPKVRLTSTAAAPAR